jgi:tetratricopeptide (TPR) repeat protein
LSPRVDASEDDQCWLKVTGDIIREALLHVKPRVRAVIERTTFGDEATSRVAKALGISERQVFRDRSEATLSIAAYLAALTPQPSIERTLTIDRLDLLGSYVSMLEQVGQLDAAENVLTRLIYELDKPRDRAILYIHLARLQLEQGAMRGARISADRALMEVAAGNQDCFASSEVESILGEIAFNEGNLAVAFRALRRSAVGHRSLLRSCDRAQAGASLARALLVQSQVESLSGRFSDAHASASEARVHLQEMFRPDPVLHLAARVSACAALAFQWSNPSMVEMEMRACFDAALSRGFLLSAIDISIYLSMIYRFRGKEDAAMELLSSLLPIVRGISTSRTKAHFFLTLANLHSLRQEGSLATRMLLEGAQATLPDQPCLEAQLRLSTARINLCHGSGMEAVNAAEEAALLFSRLGRPGLVGVSLHIESKAWVTMHQVQAAVKAARLSVDALAAAGHPQALSAARETIRCLTGGL